MRGKRRSCDWRVKSLETNLLVVLEIKRGKAREDVDKEFIIIIWMILTFTKKETILEMTATIT